jgi:hypothetical protein
LIEEFEMNIPEGWRLVPIEPTNAMLEQLTTSSWSEDQDAGMRLKLVQAKRPDFPTDEIVPPVCEMECAVGKWYRVLAAAPYPINETE